MKKEEKGNLIEKIFANINNDFFSPEERQIIELLPFFNKELVEVLDKVFLVKDSFKITDSFTIEYEEKTLKCFLIEILHDAHSSLCIKYSKIFEPGKTLFLGFRGLDTIIGKYPEKIRDKKVFSFESKKSSNKNYIPGVGGNDFQRVLPKLDFNLKKGSLILVFKEM